MSTQVFVSILLAAVLAMYLGIAIRTWTRLRGRRVVGCPESRRPAGVTVDLGHAIMSAVWERADVRIAGCSRWPERKGCGETCVPQIEASKEETDAGRIAARFFAGKRCAICQRRLTPLQHAMLQPGFMDPVSRVAVAWNDLAAEMLPDAIANQRPLCPDCTVAESSRLRFPNRVAYWRVRSGDSTTRH